MMNAAIEIQAGAGGLEPEDWADMLYRMYVRWASNKGHRIMPGRTIVYGVRDGIHLAAFEIEDAYEDLKAEAGVHRLVRHSPHDPEKRRHTSFASVHVRKAVDGHIIAPPDSAPWGSQVRSYVIEPYKLVKDLRTAVETPDVDGVLAGDIDKFLEAAKAMGLPRKNDPDAAVMD